MRDEVETVAGVAIEDHAQVGHGAPQRHAVLVHGVGTDRTIWSSSLPLLARRGPVSTLDMPGFGASGPPPGGEWTLAGVADRIAEALRERIDEPFDLVGSSLGGAVTLALAARHPAIVHRLILVGPAGFRPVPAALAGIAAALTPPFVALRRAAGLRLLEHATARRLLLAGTIADGAGLAPEGARVMLGSSAGARSLAPAFAAAARADLRRELEQLDVSVGLIWGGLDRVIPAHTAERLLAIRPEMPLELIPASGHIPHLETPELFVAALERVVSRLP